MIVHLISPAEDEFTKAAEYYENQRQGLGDEFIGEILRAANILSDFSRIGPFIEPPYRSFVVRRFLTVLFIARLKKK